MEAVVLETLGNVDGLDTSRLAERTDVEDELVRAAAVIVGVEDLVVRLEPGEDVVGIEQTDLGRARETVRAYS